MDKIKYAVVGAGVIGLSVAYELSGRSDGDIAVFEKNTGFGEETSSRNSEVVHAGIYYPKGSLKSRLCMEGNKLLYDFCDKNGVEHKKCGKLIVAVDGREAARLEDIYNNAVSMGVKGLDLIGPDEIRNIEPSVLAVKAIYSRTTGIIDSHGLMERLYELSVQRRVIFSFGNQVAGINKCNGGYIIRTSAGDELFAEKVVNCAGLYSDKVAEIAGLDADITGYRQHFCKGDYFSVSAAVGELSHLVYPVPDVKGHGLGIHATIDLSGRIRLGPDADYVEHINYYVDPAKRDYFYEKAKRMLPQLKKELLVPDTTGVRPKLHGPNDNVRDFVIKEESDRGFKGFVNLVGIESPGLTSCLSIGRYAARLID